ncbi:MAG: Telomerase protein component 1 [Chaenotheca gracillima]|nr:MAG: Telomerase protein component 1 [Chaenotheca gracillima]
MAGNEDEDDLLYDDFDDLPEQTLQELEQTAFQVSQAGRPAVGGQNQPTWKSQLVPSFGVLREGELSRGRDQLPEASSAIQGSSEFEGFDDDDLDGEVLEQVGPTLLAPFAPPGANHGPIGESTQREQWRSNRYAGNAAESNSHAPRLSDQAHLQKNRVSRQTTGGDEGEHVSTNLTPHANSLGNQNEASELLRSKVQELLQEQLALKASLRAASSAVTAKAGEISIVRANQAKAAKENERTMIAIQKMHADEAAKQRVALEQANSERQKAASNLVFLEHELKTQTDQLRALQRSAKSAQWNNKENRSAGAHNAGPSVTPQKPRNMPHRPYGDGFDDEEIMFVSPTKLNSGRSASGTPKGAKRKRKGLDDSPARPLELSQPTGDLIANEPEKADNTLNELSKPSFAKQDGRFEFLQSMFNHRLLAGPKRFIEAMTTFSLPLSADVTFSSFILERTSRLSIDHSHEAFPISFCQIIILLWSDCIQQKYYGPLKFLIDILIFAIDLETSTIAPNIVDTLLEVAQKTGDINAIPRCYKGPDSALQEGVDVSSCLHLLQITALACVDNSTDIEHFWRCMREDFVLLTMQQNQPLCDTLATIDLLSLSITEKTFGTINTVDTVIQRKNETFILTRLSELLHQSPIVGKSEKKYDTVEIARMRLSVLDLLKNICITPNGSEAMAKHNSIIGRLVRLIYDQIDALYDMRDDHDLCAEQVNLAQRIVYYLLTNHGSLINLQAKLAVISGGAHKYLVSLTRLAFSEGLVLEAGIDDEVVEHAHELLEEWVTPEEGEALWAAFAVPPAQRTSGDNVENADTTR